MKNYILPILICIIAVATYFSSKMTSPDLPYVIDHQLNQGPLVSIHDLYNGEMAVTSGFNNPQPKVEFTHLHNAPMPFPTPPNQKP